MFLRSRPNGTQDGLSGPLNELGKAGNEKNTGNGTRMKTYTPPEVAELTGLSPRAIRKRIERGQLRAVQQGRYWRIPESELIRCGLLKGAVEELATGHGNETTALLAALDLVEKAQARVDALETELRELRLLPTEVKRTEEDLFRERAARKTLEAKTEELGKELAQLTSAGLWGTFRLRRRLKQKT